MKSKKHLEVFLAVKDNYFYNKFIYPIIPAFYIIEAKKVFYSRHNQSDFDSFVRQESTKYFINGLSFFIINLIHFFIKKPENEQN